MISLDPSVIGTSGTRERDYQYDNKVVIDETLKKDLKSLGIIEKEEKPKSRDEILELAAKKEDELKEMRIGKNWYKKEGTTALDRFASGKIQKEKPTPRIIQKKSKIVEQVEEEVAPIISTVDSDDDVTTFTPFKK
jgi:hypothetical protein